MDKICSTCKEKKPFSCFDKQYKAKDGLQFSCKECLKVKQRERYARNREKEIKRSKAWNQKNPRRVADNMAKCRAKDPEKYRLYNVEWRINNKTKVKMYDVNKRAKIRIKNIGTNAAIESISDKDWFNILQFQNNKCFYCEKDNPDTIDHVIAISKGGGHSKSNIVAACSFCNTSKSNMNIIDFITKKGIK